MGATFVVGLSDKEVYEENDFSLEVTLSKPQAEVSWLLDDLEIKPSEKYEFTAQGAQRQLSVHNVTLDDEGEYTCLLGDQSTTAFVAVLGKVGMRMACDFYRLNVSGFCTRTLDVDFRFYS